MKKIQDAGIRLEDCRYIDLYADYMKLLGHGEKVSYIVAALSDKYLVSERKVYSLIKRFQSDCKNVCSVNNFMYRAGLTAAEYFCPELKIISYGKIYV